MSGVPAMMMEGIMSFAAGWCTTNQVVKLRCESASVLELVKEWEHKGIVDDMDEQTWEVMPEGNTLAERCARPAVKDPLAQSTTTFVKIPPFLFCLKKRLLGCFVVAEVGVTKRLRQKNSCCDLNSADRASSFLRATCDAPESWSGKVPEDCARVKDKVVNKWASRRPATKGCVNQLVESGCGEAE